MTPHREEILKARAIGRVGGWASVCLLEGAVFGQQVQQTPTADSHLFLEDLLRVGASQDQIHAVLRFQPTSMTKPERRVDQEAVATGQVSKDVDLTDQEIFAQLVSDMAFRSAATRPRELSGYLVPKQNPDSLAGEVS